jgi:hypothetical protein
MLMKFQLFGALAGKTIALGKHWFVNGSYTIEESPENLNHLQRYLSYYRAYAEGSAEYEEAKADGDRNKTDESSGSGDPERVSSDDDSAREGATDLSDALGDEFNSAPDGNSGLGSGWDGHENSGLSERPEPGNNGSAFANQVDTNLVRAIEALDAAEDSHWTKAGLPAIVAVEQAYGSTDVTRALIEAAKPGWTREQALADVEIPF